MDTCSRVAMTVRSGCRRNGIPELADQWCARPRPIALRFNTAEAHPPLLRAPRDLCRPVRPNKAYRRDQIVGLTVTANPPYKLLVGYSLKVLF